MQIQTEQFKSFILSNINLAEELLTASEELSVKIRTVTDNFVNIIGTIAPEYLNFFLILSTNLKNKMIQLRLELQGIYQTCQVLKNNYEENLEFLHYLAHFKKKEVKDVNMATKENNMKHISTRKRKRRKINLTPHLDKYCRILTEFRPTKIGSYDSICRLRKIVKYKVKKIIKKMSKNMSRKYPLRSQAAKLKLRSRGKFIKKDSITSD